MLLTDAMGRCSTLGMASYDRLFPSQDTLPNGGFGNLIALPLQFEARRHGNSVFLDEELEVGVLCAPPGIGKTVIAAHLIAARGCSTLVVVHSKPLLEQWVQRLTEFLDLDVKQIGVIGAGRSKPTGRLDVATVQSLARREQLQELLGGCGHVVVDECHHVPAVTTERVLQSAPARYVTGLTATPYRRDGHHPIITMQCGPIRHEINRHAARSGAQLNLRIVRRETAFDPAVLPTDAGIQEIYGALATDERRTELIAQDTIQLTAEGRSPIVLTERREHLRQLADCLRDRIPVLIELHGDMRPSARRSAIEQLTTTSADTERVVLATGRYIGEGFDDSRLDTLLLAMPIAWKGTVVQYAGRLHRQHPGKHDALVYDYVDTELPVLRRMFAKRLKTYRTLGYELVECRGDGSPILRPEHERLSDVQR